MSNELVWIVAREKNISCTFWHNPEFFWDSQRNHTSALPENRENLAISHIFFSASFLSVSLKFSLFSKNLLEEYYLQSILCLWLFYHCENNSLFSSSKCLLFEGESLQLESENSFSLKSFQCILLNFSPFHDEVMIGILGFLKDSQGLMLVLPCLQDKVDKHKKWLLKFMMKAPQSPSFSPFLIMNKFF